MIVIFALEFKFVFTGSDLSVVFLIGTNKGSIFNAPFSATF